MIVPIILNYNFKYKNKHEGLWIFYKFLDFARKNNTCIIGRECYYDDPETYKETWDLDPNVLKMYNYEYPDKKYLETNKKYMIKSTTEQYLIDNKIDWSYLLTNNCKEVCDAINDALDKIEEDKNEKVEIVITWYPFKSLESVCKKRKIKMLSVEFSAIRKEWYNETLSSISLNSKYNSYNDVIKINDMNFKDKIILTREELITLFSYTNNLFDNLRFLKASPMYEIGYALGLDKDPYERAYYNIEQKNIIKELNAKYDKNQILLRLHPQLKSKVSGNIDDSGSAREFISKCDKLIIVVSNVGYEASLYGRKVSYLNKKFLPALNEESALNNLSDSVISLEKLNFITFGLYTLFDNLFKPKFLTNFAGEKININDLYVENMKQIFKKFGLDYEVMKTTCGKKRLKYMLKKIHELSDSDIKELYKINYGKSAFEENAILKQQVESLKAQNDALQNDLIVKDSTIYEYDKALSEITNSRVWVMAEKFRKIRKKMRRK